MKAALETPRLNAEKGSFIAFARTEPGFAWNWHHHPEFELTWIRQGRGTRLVGDSHERYTRDDLVLLAPHLPHTWVSAKGAGRQRAVVVQFSRACFPESLLARPEFKAVARLLGEAVRGVQFTPAVARSVTSRLEALPARDGLEGWTQLAIILGELADAKSARPLSSARYRNRRTYHLNNRLERTLARIEETYREAVPLGVIAKKCGLSASAFARLLRKLTGKTYVQVRNARRVQEACRLLTETDLPVTSVALESGFENLSHFHRVFREGTQVTPKGYRQLHEAPLAPSS